MHPYLSPTGARKTRRSVTITATTWPSSRRTASGSSPTSAFLTSSTTAKRRGRKILKIRQTIYKKRHAKVLSEKKKKLSHAGKQCQKGELPVVKCEASDSEVDIKQETNDSEDFSVDTKDSDDSLCVAMPECINDGALMMRSLESEGAHMVGDKDDNMFWAML